MKVAFAGAFAARLVEPVRTRLSVPCELLTGDEVSKASHLSDIDVPVSMSFTADVARRARRLRLVPVPGAGLDRVDIKAFRPGIHLAKAYGHEAGIAEYIVGAMISLTRSFAHLDAELRQSRWESQWAVGVPAPPLWPELAGKTLGILGFGHIGQAVARRAVALDMHVCAIRREAQREIPSGVSFVGGPERLEEVLRTSDYLAVTISLSSATHNLIGEQRLRLMKPGAFLINVARAEIFDEAAIYAALSCGRIAGAAFDVWYRYPISSEPTPPATLPFHTLSNVMMTPHVSGWTERMLAARARVIANNIERTARGEPPLNAIALAS